MTRIVLVAAGLFTLVSGCTSTGHLASGDDGVDYDKVALVNSVARARGVEIHWFRYPQRRSAPTDVVPSLGEPTGT